MQYQQQRRAMQRVGQHLANRNKIRVSGSDSYALLFFLYLLKLEYLVDFLIDD